MQETKLPSLDKLTKDLACVQGFESFWAVSREKKGYSGKEAATEEHMRTNFGQRSAKPKV